MPRQFLGRFWHALKRHLGTELVARIAEALAGQGIRLHWDFLVEVPLRQLWPELAAAGVPENQWPDDRNADGSAFWPGHFDDGYGYARGGCDTSSESNPDSDYDEPTMGPRARDRRRLQQRRRLHAGWRFAFGQPAPPLAIPDA